MRRAIIEGLRRTRTRLAEIEARCNDRQARINRLKLELGNPALAGTWLRADASPPIMREYLMAPKALNSNSRAWPAANRA